MKKLIKISLMTLAAFLLLLNVSLNLVGNEISDINVSTKIKPADASVMCYFWEQYGNCFCMQVGYPCFSAETCDYYARCTYME